MAFLLWGILALGLGGALVFSSQLEFLVPAVAALLVLVVAAIPGLSENYLLQTLLWLALSGGGLVMFRDRLRRVRLGSRKAVEDPVAGRLATVIEAIAEDHPGRVRFQGTTWVATAAAAVPVGAEVTILSQDGLVLLVEAPEPDRVEEQFRALEAGNSKEE